MGEIPVSRVAELRKKVEITQRQLAEKVGVTETTVRNWENNRSGVEWFERVSKLCNALECSPNELFQYIEAGEKGTHD
jgi:transcriptional regulator with XRE-family HTH domain